MKNQTQSMQNYSDGTSTYIDLPGGGGHRYSSE